MKNNDLQKISRKLGEYGIVINSSLLMGSVIQDEKLSLITIGVLSSSLIGSSFLLVKAHKYSKCQKDAAKVKLKK